MNNLNLYNIIHGSYIAICKHTLHSYKRSIKHVGGYCKAGVYAQYMNIIIIMHVKKGCSIQIHITSHDHTDSAHSGTTGPGTQRERIASGCEMNLS